MKVYIVFDYWSEEIIAAYSSKEAAERHPGLPREGVTVDEQEVDPDLALFDPERGWRLDR